MSVGATLALVASFAGGLGFFLLGMHQLTEGLKLAAGGALRRILQGSTSTRLRALAAGAGMMTVMFIQYFLTKKWDLLFTLNGSLAGLVAITAGCAFVSPAAAVLMLSERSITSRSSGMRASPDFSPLRPAAHRSLRVKFPTCWTTWTGELGCLGAMRGFRAKWISCDSTRCPKQGIGSHEEPDSGGFFR